MKYFILSISLVMLPSQLLQANNMVHPATLQDLAAGKLSLRFFLNSRLLEAAKINYQMIGNSLHLNPKIIEVYMEFMDEVLKVGSQVTDVSASKQAAWNGLELAGNGLTMPMQDVAEKLGVSIKDAERLLRIRVFLTEMGKLAEQRRREKMPSSIALQKMSELFSNYKDLSPYVSKVIESISEKRQLMHAAKDFPKAGLVEGLQKEISALYDMLLQEVGEKLGFDYVVDAKNSVQSSAELQSKVLKEIIHSMPYKERDLHKDALYRIDIAINLINEQVSRGVDPNIKQVSRMLAIRDADTVRRFTHLVALNTSVTTLLQQKTDTTVATEKNFISDVEQLLRSYGASAFDAEELQELQEAMRIAAAAQTAQ